MAKLLGAYKKLSKKMIKIKGIKKVKFKYIEGITAQGIFFDKYDGSTDWLTYLSLDEWSADTVRFNNIINKL